MRRNPYILAWGNRSLEFGRRTLVMGILNITPDSFSDGGKFERIDDALRQAEQMIAEGADIIDIGGESSRPFSDPVPADVEIRRTVPVIERLAGKSDIPLSIDTTKASVAEAALKAGASIINDISALRLDPDLAGLAAGAGVPVILMHMQGTPQTMQSSPVYENVTREVAAFLEEAVAGAVAQGMERSRIIIDPGFGFGKTFAHNLTLLRNLPALTELGQPVMVGVSRKAFIRSALTTTPGEAPSPDSPAVAGGTQAAIAAAVMGGADIVRVHDVASTRVTVRIIDAMKDASS